LCLLQITGGGIRARQILFGMSGSDCFAGCLILCLRFRKRFASLRPLPLLKQINTL
jgi:hypothetical protein